MNAALRIARDGGAQAPSTFDPADWLARFEAGGLEVHLSENHPVVRTPGEPFHKMLSCYHLQGGDALGIRFNELPALAAYMRSIGRRNHAAIGLEADLPDAMMEHAGERAPFALLAGDRLTVGSLPGLRGSGYYVWRWTAPNEGEEVFALVGWVNGRTAKGAPRVNANLRRWGFKSVRSTMQLYRVIRLERPVL